MESLTTQKTPLEDTMDRLLRNLYEGISNLRFRLDIEDNLFQQSSKGHKPVLPTFSTWKSMDYAYYYNILKNKGPAKRKVTFGQTITSQPSNTLSEKPSRYQTRYQTRTNNSPEESPDDDNDDDDDSDQGNNPLNRQPNQPPNQPPSPLPNQNMNDRNGGNNPPDGGQNNIMA